MVAFVVIANGLIGCLCLFVAVKIWQIRAGLAQASETLISVEQAVHNCLYGAPTAITKGQMGVYQLRQNYQHLEIQLKRAEQVLALLSMGRMLWRRQSVGSPRPRSERRMS
jgi:hypothetical protein